MNSIKARGKTSVVQSVSVNFISTIEYKLQEDQTRKGAFKINYPLPFPSKYNTQKLQFVEQEGIITNTIQLILSEQDIGTILQNRFHFTLYFLFDMLVTSNLTSKDENSGKYNEKQAYKDKLVEKQMEYYIQLDGHILLLPNTFSVTTTKSPPLFQKVKFTVTIDNPLLHERHMMLYQPVFIKIGKVENMPERPYSFQDLTELYAPVFFKAILDEKEYFICPQTHQTNHTLETVLIKFNRSPSTIRFEIHDRAKSLPFDVQYYGSDLVLQWETGKIDAKKTARYNLDTQLNPNMDMPNPCGYAESQILPEAKRRVDVRPELHSKSPCPVGNFSQYQTQFVFNVYDPCSKLAEQSDDHTIRQLPVNKERRKSDSSLQTEPSHSDDFHRWVLCCDRNVDTETFILLFDNTLFETHKKVFAEKNITTVKSYDYESAMKKTNDVITGFHLITPDEHIYVLETLVDPKPQSKSGKNVSCSGVLESFFKAAPNSVKVLYDTNVYFSPPRKYSEFQTLIYETTLPVNIMDLVRVDALYFRSSTLYCLYGIVQKVYSLYKAARLKDIQENKGFPEKHELLQLISQGDSLFTHVERKIKSSLETAISLSTRRSKIAVSSSHISIGLNSVDKSNRPLTSRHQKTPHIPSLNTYKNREPFVIYGINKPPKKYVTPRDRIGINYNGEEELWYTNDINKVMEPGWKIKVIKSQTSLIPRNTSNILKLKSVQEN